MICSFRLFADVTSIRTIHHLTDAEINNFCLVRVIKENILWFDVTMYYALFVAELQALAHFSDCATNRRLCDVSCCVDALIATIWNELMTLWTPS